MLFRAWETWCDERNYKAGDAGTFGRNLLAAHPDINPNARDSGPGRLWHYKGIGLNPEERDGPVPFGRRLAGLS